MMFFSEQQIVNSWVNLIELAESKKSMSLNKFFGLLEIMGAINEKGIGKIQPGIQYSVNGDVLANSLQAKYYFGDDLRNFSGDKMYVLFPSNWDLSVSEFFLGNEKLNFTDVAPILYQSIGLENKGSLQDLRGEFEKQFMLKDSFDIFFDFEDSQLSLTDSSVNRKSLYRSLLTRLGIESESASTIAFNRAVVKANAGELSRGPLIQVLYSAQENLKCLVISNFNFSEIYKLNASHETSLSSIRNDKILNSSVKNRILYGPPGTGKTYNAVSHAVSIISGDQIDMRDRKAVKMEFDRLMNEGQIQMITFHQSYSYEEFVEGIKPLTNQGQIHYEIVDGIFKQICLKAQERASILNFNDYYESFVSDVIENGNSLDLVSLKQGKPFTVRVNDNRNCVAIPKTDLATEMTITKKAIQNYLENGVENDWKTYTKAIAKYISDNYIKENLSEDNTKKKFVLIIDEINRGNISKIFGELITLIEDSKRIGCEEELRLRLAYSGISGHDLFGVPDNLYIVGTMNSTDRSIALIDTALRRRFTFIEQAPDSAILKETIDGVNLNKLLDTLNERLEYLLDRDHLIGHSYFIGVKDKDGLIDVFRNKIIPLLEEFFYGDYTKMQLVLGDLGSEKPDELKIIRKKSVSSEMRRFKQSIDGLDDKDVFELDERIRDTQYASVSAEMFTAIYMKI